MSLKRFFFLFATLKTLFPPVIFHRNFHQAFCKHGQAILAVLAYACFFTSAFFNASVYGILSCHGIFISFSQPAYVEVIKPPCITLVYCTGLKRILS